MAQPLIQQLRICQSPGCWGNAHWDETRTGGMYCGRCVAIRAVNHLIESCDADQLESILGIRCYVRTAKQTHPIDADASGMVQ